MLCFEDTRTGFPLTASVAILVAIFVSSTLLGPRAALAQDAESVKDDPEYGPALSDPSQTITLDVDGDKVTVRYDVTAEGDAIVQGDIIIGPAAVVEEAREQSDLVPFSQLDLFGLFRKGRGYLWPKGEVRYLVSADLHNKGYVTRAVTHWESKTKIRFKKITRPSGNYIKFVNASRICSSSVGMQRGGQLIKLDKGCSYGAVVHEIGHALGLGHEHMRSDRAKYVRYIEANVEANKKHNFNIKTWKYKDIGAYCYSSIMHYAKTAFGRKQANGRRRVTLEPKKSGVRIGQRSGLAGCDIATIARMYKNEFARR